MKRYYLNLFLLLFSSVMGSKLQSVEIDVEIGGVERKISVSNTLYQVAEILSIDSNKHPSKNCVINTYSNAFRAHQEKTEESLKKIFQSETDQVIIALQFLKELEFRNDRHDQTISEKFYAPLIEHKDLLLASIEVELQLLKEGKNPLWRFTTDMTPTKSYRVRKPEVSYSDGLLSGYVQDGYLSMKPEEGLTNYSACTFSYYVIHKKFPEFREKEPLAKSNADYVKYHETLNQHSIYAIGYTKQEDDNNEWLKKPTEFPSKSREYQFKTQFLCGRGEDFHPKVKNSDDPDYTKALEDRRVIYTDLKVQTL